MDGWQVYQSSDFAKHLDPDVFCLGNIARTFVNGTLNTVEAWPTPQSGLSVASNIFWSREYCAAEFPFECIQSGKIRIADPYGLPDAMCDAHGLAVIPDLPGSYVLSQIYAFESAGQIFYAVFTSIFGRLTHLFFPKQRIVIKHTIAYATEALCKYVDDQTAQAETAFPIRPFTTEKPIVFVDHVNGFGHGLWNHISGIQRLCDLGLLQDFAELWVTGRLFFGRIEDLFPELVGRIRYFEKKSDLALAAQSQTAAVLQIGSCFFTAAARARVCNAASRHVGIHRPAKPKPATPVVTFTIRAGNRVCLNLAEAIPILCKPILDLRPDTKIILDGWVLPDDASVHESSQLRLLKSPHASSIKAELQIASQIAESLPMGTTVLTTVGKGMLESIDLIQHTTLYFSHVGTLQHKIAYLADCDGLIHGPSVQLTRKEAGNFAYEGQGRPIFIDGAFVEDVAESDQTRGGLSSAYVLCDMDRLAMQFREMFIEAVSVQD